MKKTTDNNEIKTPEEYWERFKALITSISEPEHFVKTIDLLNTANIGGALVYATGGEDYRGIRVTMMFDRVVYNEELNIVTFVRAVMDKDEKIAISDEFDIPVEEMESANGFINNEDDGQGDFYCLNIETMEGCVTIVWRL